MRYFPPISPYAAGFGCKCPRCGQGRLFATFLGLAPSCEACGLDFSKADSGDGPAVFVIFIVGFIAVALAFLARFSWGLSIALSLLISLGVSVAATLALLRPLKAAMIALQYQQKADEGRLEE